MFFDWAAAAPPPRWGTCPSSTYCMLYCVMLLYYIVFRTYFDWAAVPPRWGTPAPTLHYISSIDTFRLSCCNNIICICCIFLHIICIKYVTIINQYILHYIIAWFNILLHVTCTACITLHIIAYQMYYCTCIKYVTIKKLSHRNVYEFHYTHYYILLHITY